VHSDAETKQFFHFYIGMLLCRTSLISTVRHYVAAVHAVVLCMSVCPMSSQYNACIYNTHWVRHSQPQFRTGYPEFHSGGKLINLTKFQAVIVPQ